MGSEARTQTRTLLWVLLALILGFSAVGVVMALTLGNGDGMGGMMGLGGGWWGIMMVVPALVLVLIILVIVGAFDSGYHPSNYPPAYYPPSGGAQEALDLRLARGEIDIQEYKRLKEELRR